MCFDFFFFLEKILSKICKNTNIKNINQIKQNKLKYHQLSGTMIFLVLSDYTKIPTNVNTHQNSDHV